MPPVVVSVGLITSIIAPVRRVIRDAAALCEKPASALTAVTASETNVLIEEASLS